jgi:L-fuconolactonase
VLVAHERAGGGRFRGIRHITAWDADPQVVNPGNPAVAGMLGDAKFREGFAVLARMGYAFDAWLYHPQIDELTRLADAFPDARIVLNHCGGIVGLNAYKKDEVLPVWKKSIEALAKRPNVHVKLGGLGMRLCGHAFDKQAEPPSSQQLADTWRPYMEACIAAFGPARSMFESNFPVDKGSYSYWVFWNACKLLAKGASAAEKADLFLGTAKRFYRLDGIG